MIRRFAVWAVVFALALGALAGCGQRQSGGDTGGEQPAPQEQVTLTVMGPWAGAEMEQFVPVLREAEKKLGFKIEYRTYRAEDEQSLLPAQFEAKQTPGDVIFMWDWWIKENAKHAVDLRDVWQPESGQIVLQAGEAEGKVVSIPYALVVKPGFWYRKSFFQQHGLKPPTTWDEFVSLLEQIKKIDGIKDPIASGDGVGWPLSDVTEHFLIAYGGPQLHRDLIAGTVKWTDPRVKSVFTDYLVPTLQYFSDPIEWTQAKDLWWNGEYALYFMGNWITGMVDDPDDLGVFPLPGTKGVVVGADYMFVPAYSQHVEQAKQLVAYLISKEGMEVRARQGGKISSRKDTPADVYPPADRAMVEAISGVSDWLSDLDDSVGGDWQRTFWDQLKLLWVQPDALDDVLQTLDENR